MLTQDGGLRLFGFTSQRYDAVQTAWSATCAVFPHARQVLTSPGKNEQRRDHTFAVLGECRPEVQFASVPDGSWMVLDGQISAAEEAGTSLAHTLGSYLREGEEYLETLDFAGFAAAWNAQSGRLVLLRDRFGVAPAFYAVSGEGTAFSSDIATLVRLGFGSGIDEIAIAQFLELGFFAAPATPVLGIAKIPPAHSVTFTAEGAPRPRHWTPRRDASRLDSREPTVGDVFREKFESALRRRWSPAEVHGLLLSGGVDSALLLGGVRRLLHTDIRTFTFRYTEYDGRFNEGSRARAVAAHLGAPHEEIVVSPDQMWNDLDDLVRAYGEPLTWGLHSYHLAPLAAAGVTTLFSGAGPDGWSLPKRYRAALTVRRWPSLAGSAIRGALAATRPLHGRRLAKLRRALGNATDLAELFFQVDMSRRASNRALFQDSVLQERGRQAALNLFRDAISDYHDEPDERILLLLGKRFQTAESILFWNTAWTRAHGLHLQVPYFDRDLAQFALHLDASVSGKDLVRRLAAEFIPHEMSHAPKLPQEIPVGHWLRGPLQNRARTRLRELPPMLASILDPVGVRRMLDEHVEGRVDNGWTLIGLVTAAVWCEQLAAMSVAGVARAMSVSSL